MILESSLKYCFFCAFGADGIDVLVTHGPPAGHGDIIKGNRCMGCQDLLNRVIEYVLCLPYLIL